MVAAAIDMTRVAEQKRAWEAAAAVLDPEVPAVTVEDLGILRSVEIDDDGVAVAKVTPTYSGCPAVLAIELAIEAALLDAGFNPKIERVISPAWTTDWMSDTARSKLEEFGIAPPAHSSCKNQSIRCPRCATGNVALLSEYGSTACKSMYRCGECAETFCYFKQI